MDGVAWISLDMIMTGNRLRNVITKRGYSIKDIQNKLELSCPQPIYRWLNGQTLPSLDNLYRLSTILGMQMEELLMLRNDKMWFIYGPENNDQRRRYKRYFGETNKLCVILRKLK